MRCGQDFLESAGTACSVLLSRLEYFTGVAWDLPCDCGAEPLVASRLWPWRLCYNHHGICSLDAESAFKLVELELRLVLPLAASLAVAASVHRRTRS